MEQDNQDVRLHYEQQIFDLLRNYEMTGKLLKTIEEFLASGEIENALIAIRNTHAFCCSIIDSAKKKF